MFIDTAKIYVKAGDGGRGCIAFRREKFVPRGGPSGGDGGKGGDVHVRSNSQMNTLLKFRFNQHFVAERGQHGMGSLCHGKDGADLVIQVPVGTLIFDDEDHRLLYDFQHPDEQVVIARAGKGGRGNAAFKSSTNQAPRRAEEGLPGEQKTLRLELKLLADIGLIGFPNVGKSTLISVISAARPKIANYPFTTLTPHLGVVEYDEERHFVVADIPGLIEGAHSGSGLGDRFLRHVERTKLLAHLIDVSDESGRDPVEDYEVIQRELHLFNPGLAQKPQILVASKVDILHNRERLNAVESLARRQGLEFVAISAATQQGVKQLVDLFALKLQQAA
ncbi:MAG TPA: GTPase ObgE [Acidobacteriota bacterium]|nr:GTPase ObgE [Acidobacteriota bacterium]